MDEKEIRKIFLTLMYAALNEEPLTLLSAQQLTNEVQRQVYSLARRHDLSHIIFDVFHQNQIAMEETLRLRLQQHRYAAVCRCEQIKYAQDQIFSIFEKAQIAHIPLKGAILRSYYPGDNMRTSCDIDILVHESDLDAAIASLVADGFRCEERHYHDVSLFAPNGIHLELHFNIQENINSLDVILRKAWQYTKSTEKQYRYTFTDEFFVFHMLAHMAYHFMRGGCGIRSLIDLWIMNHKMGLTYEIAEPLLKKAGIYRFAQEMSNIAEQCFTENQTDNFADSVLNYILVGGIYGSKKNHMTVRKTQAKNTFTYTIQRLFMPMDSMKNLYPILKKAPILLPFCWIARWFNMLFGGKMKNAVTELSYTKTISESQMQEIRDIFLRLDL